MPTTQPSGETTCIISFKGSSIDAALWITDVLKSDENDNCRKNKISHCVNKTLNTKFVLLVAAITFAARLSFALDGQIGIHDPSTVIQCEGKYYVFGTGG